MRLLTYLFCALFFLQFTLSWAEAKEAKVDPAWEGMAFHIEESRAFVGIAPVYLTVSKLIPEGAYLVGTYKIHVPLKTSKNDQGKIVLPLDVTVSELGTKGGVLKGKAHSQKDESKVNLIVCEVIPQEDQAIRLAITTEDRTINFKSSYTVIKAGG